jgi:hypothetical protein
MYKKLCVYSTVRRVVGLRTETPLTADVCYSFFLYLSTDLRWYLKITVISESLNARRAHVHILLFNTQFHDYFIIYQ